MPKKKIVITGGGFAGVSAVRYLGRRRGAWSREFELVLIDPKENFEFLPMLPDILTGRVEPKTLCYPLGELCRRFGARFIQTSAEGIDHKAKIIYTGAGPVEYEYAILSPGSKTNFYGNKELESSCFRLDGVSDAVSIKMEMLLRVSTKNPVNVLVVGGGYTGVEIASGVNFFLKRAGADCKVILSEKAPHILSSSPEWMGEYVRQKLENSGIEILPGQELKKAKDGDAFMISGRKIDRAMCIWAAGVRTPGFLEALGKESFKTRLNVNEYLNLTGVPYDKYLFVSGDAAAFYSQRSDSPVRMAVMFAIGQGVKAAENILLGIKGKPGSIYRAVDLGYIIPMAIGLAPGIVLGRTVNPKIGYLLHYFMCFYRATFRGKIKMIRDLILKRREK